MKKLLAVGIAAVLVVLAVVAVTLTSDRRTAGARKNLDRAAAQFTACYARSRSYEKCDPGTSKIAVTFRTRSAFALTASVEFSATYTIARKRDGELIRTCQPRGAHCPEAGWQALP